MPSTDSGGICLNFLSLKFSTKMFSAYASFLSFPTLFTKRVPCRDFQNAGIDKVLEF